MAYLANATRPKGAPRVISTGHSSLSRSDRWARNLGWLSIALGAAQIVGARHVNAALGLRPHSVVPVVFGTREIMQGILCLSVDKRAGVWSRVAGDALDIAFLMRVLDRRTPQTGNVKAALTSVLAMTAVDLAVAILGSSRASGTPSRRYADRSGFPQGLAAARSLPYTAALRPGRMSAIGHSQP